MAVAYLACLGLDMAEIPRFRDCYVKDDRVVIFTRTGGDNRPDYHTDLSPLYAHPCFVSDEDDPNDCTYAHLSFSFPAQYEAVLTKIAEADRALCPTENFSALFKSLRED